VQWDFLFVEVRNSAQMGLHFQSIRRKKDMRNVYNILAEKPEGKGTWEDLDVDGRIKLE
jgi:hypothetical protein